MTSNTDMNHGHGHEKKCLTSFFRGGIEISKLKKSNLFVLFYHKLLLGEGGDESQGIVRRRSLSSPLIMRKEVKGRYY